MNRKRNYAKGYKKDYRGRIWTKQNLYEKVSKEIFDFTTDVGKAGILIALAIGIFYFGRATYHPKVAAFDKKYRNLIIDNKYFLIEDPNLKHPDLRGTELFEEMFLFRREDPKNK